jgi:Ca-activated chloride channel family protein
MRAPAARVVVAALALGGTALPAQQPTFRAGIEIVRLDVSVTRDDEPVVGLTAADFEVRDNGKRQQLAGVLREEVPLDVYFVFDTSGSVRGRKRDDLRRAAHAFLSGLVPGDQAALLTFSHEVCLLRPLTADLGAVGRVVDALEPGGSTALNDGIYAALLQRTPNQRRAVLVAFSDGLENVSWLTVDTVVEAAKRFDAVIYGVTLLAPSSPPRVSVRQPATFPAPREDELLRRVALATGGRVWAADSSERLENTFTDVLREIRSRYLLTYEPEPAGRPGWHDVQVKVKRSKGVVTSRPGYYAR